MIGFEPGYQAAKGVWEGEDVDHQVIEYIQKSDLGGIMFWAINDMNTCNTGHCSQSGDVTKDNVDRISKYASSIF